MEEYEGTPALDARLRAAAQAVEHYEMYVREPFEFGRWNSALKKSPRYFSRRSTKSR